MNDRELHEEVTAAIRMAFDHDVDVTSARFERDMIATTHAEPERVSAALAAALAKIPRVDRHLAHVVERLEEHARARLAFARRTR